MDRPDGTLDWKARDNALLALLDVHPLTIHQAVDIGIYPSYQKAWQRFNRLSKRNARQNDSACWISDDARRGPAGKPVLQLATEERHARVHVTHVLVPFIRAGCRIKRVNTDAELRPDATLLLQHTIHVEVDMGTLSAVDLKVRMKLYQRRDELVVWVADAERVKLLHSLAEPISEIVMFSTFSHCRTKWWDYERNEIPVEKLYVRT